jgi:hypothetical protein
MVHGQQTQDHVIYDVRCCRQRGRGAGVSHMYIRHTYRHARVMCLLGKTKTYIPTHGAALCCAVLCCAGRLLQPEACKDEGHHELWHGEAAGATFG